MPEPAIYGEINPELVIQQDTRACFSACVLSLLDRELNPDISEAAVSQALIEAGIYIEGVGSSFFSAEELDLSVKRFGLSAYPVYELSIDTNDEDINLGYKPTPEQEQQQIENRIETVAEAIRSNDAVIVAYPKKRDNDPLQTIAHYSVITGFEETDEGSFVTLMDPSDVDGEVKQLDVYEFIEMLTPSEGFSIMAWGIRQGREASASFKMPETANEDEIPGLDLLKNPLWRAEDKGKPVPANTIAPTGVVVPDTLSTHQFRVSAAGISHDGLIPTGYPRYVKPRTVSMLTHEGFGQPGWVPCPDEQSALAISTLAKSRGEGTNIHSQDGIWWVENLGNDGLIDDGWQLTGTGLTARHANSLLEGGDGEVDIARRNAAEAKIKTEIQSYTDTDPSDIYLFPTGMAAIYWLNQVLIKQYEGAPAVQFGFSYADTYEQRMLGPDANPGNNFIDLRTGDYVTLDEKLASQKSRGIFTEWPSNPLLAVPDFEKLDTIGRRRGIPVIVDDTIGSMYNLSPDLPASIAAVVSSGTKLLNAPGNATLGIIRLNKDNSDYERIKTGLEAIYKDTLWHEDAEVSARNIMIYRDIMPTINSNTQQLAEWLHEEYTGEGKPLANVYYPSLTGKAAYDAVKTTGGGYGPLMSLRFNDPSRAFRTFDNIRITKTPGLGYLFSTACLQTLLAHKHTFGVKRFGVTEDIFRISTGIEDIDDLKQRYGEAIEQSAA